MSEGRKFCYALNERNPYAMARLVKNYHSKNLSTLASLKMIAIVRKNHHLEKAIILAMKRST